MDSGKTLRWLAKQCVGLAEGLDRLHRHHTFLQTCGSLPREDSIPCETLIPIQDSRPSQMEDPSQEITLFGRHGDIKPENILWFPACQSPMDASNGILKIADFGLTKFSKETTRSRSQSHVIQCTKSYMAPECRSGHKSGMLGPLTDIWSLGCVYLEFLAWFVGGGKSVEDFRRKRRCEVDSEFPELRIDDRFFIVSRLSDTRHQRAQARVKTSVVQVGVPSTRLPCFNRVIF